MGKHSLKLRVLFRERRDYKAADEHLKTSFREQKKQKMKIAASLQDSCPWESGHESSWLLFQQPPEEGLEKASFMGNQKMPIKNQ